MKLRIAVISGALVLIGLESVAHAYDFDFTEDSLASISWQIGSLPANCIIMPDSQKRCVWNVDDSHDNWQEMYEYFGRRSAFDDQCKNRYSAQICKKLYSKKRFHVICNDGRDISCSAYALWLNRARQKQPISSSKNARKFLDELASFDSVVEFTGDIPRRCMRDEFNFICEWEAGYQTPGYAGLAIALDGHQGAKIRMLCSFKLSPELELNRPCKLSHLD